MFYIKFEQVSKYYGDRVILEGAVFFLGAGQKVGLVGRNGQGKTTLFRLITGGEEYDSGLCEVSGKLGYLPQHDTAFPGSVMEFLLSTGQPEHRIKKVLEPVGLAERHLGLKYSVLSGGEKTRVKIARLLLDESDILLLDEPTNHLDAGGLEWLEQFVVSFRGAVLIVSHDRHFLDRTVEKILELENGRLEEYAGNYSDYTRQKEQRLERRLQEYEAYLKERKKLEDTIRKKMQKADRVAKKSRPRDSFEARGRKDFFAAKAKKVARNAKAIEKRLDMLPKKEKPLELKSINAKLRQGDNSGSGIVVEGNGLRKSYGCRMLFSEAGFTVTKGRSIALLGPNGVGKTTLLRIITGELEPDSGKIRLAPMTAIGYLDQELKHLDPNRTILDEIVAHHGGNRSEARTILGSLLFRGDDVYKKIFSLSMGERVKLTLARLILSGCNFLIMDEPTNHLDLPSREAVENALQNYSGTLLFVCHDRYFLDKMADEIWEIKDGGLRCYPMTYREYVAREEKMKGHDEEQLLLLETRLARLTAELNQCVDEAEKEALNREFLGLVRKISRISSKTGLET